MKFLDRSMTDKDYLFVIYFIPLFWAKLLNWTASDIRLIVIALVCFCLWIVRAIMDEYPKKELCLWIVLGAYASLLVLTSGKEGVLFTVVTFMAMRNVNMKNVYRICLFVGVIAVLVSMFIEREGGFGTRYMNGEWITVYKRSNILYIAFFAVVSIFMLYYRDKVNITIMLFVTLCSLVMYKYSGARTGLVCSAFQFFLFILFSFSWIKKSKLVKYGCMCFPLGCFLLNYGMCFLYGKIPFLYRINNSMQGRLQWGKKYIDIYSVKLFGQRIAEDFSAESYMVLDAAYMDMLLAYGLIFTLCWVWLSAMVIKYLFERNRFVEITIVLTYALYGIMETFLPNCFLNVSLFLYCEYIMFLLSKGRAIIHEKK